MNLPVAPILFQRCAISDIFELRYSILRTGLPRTSAVFPGDDETTTLHCAACSGPTTVGCASWMLNTYDDQVAYQLRGMAVARECQGQGIGQGLLTFSDAELADLGVPLRWCNARVAAIPFYERNGWVVASELFDIPTAGPHRRMTFQSLRSQNAPCKMQG